MYHIVKGLYKNNLRKPRKWPSLTEMDVHIKERNNKRNFIWRRQTNSAAFCTKQ